MDVWRIKLTAKEARRGNVPFSLFYLFPGDKVEVFRQSFETFIGFGARHSTIKWDSLRILFEGAEEDTFLTQIVRDLTDIDANWHVAVPVLALNTRGTRTGRHPVIERTSALDLGGVLELYKEATEHDGPRPAYLTDRAWANWKAVDGKPEANPAYPPTSYFVTRDDIFIPPCLACPRIGYHEAGECHLGDPICYVSLRYYNSSARMFVKLREYDELQETIDGLPQDELHSTDAQPPTPSVPSDAD